MGETDLPGPRQVRGLSLSVGELQCGVCRHDRARSRRLARRYRRDGGTFSLYLEGGGGTRRVDRRSPAGWPGALCFMPHGTSSDWEITSPFA
ncbi:hypothetical protein D3272_26875, partial [Lichenibacterium ramalinae]